MLHAITFWAKSTCVPVELSHEARWLIGDRRRHASHMIGTTTSRTAAALIIGSLIGLCAVAISVTTFVH